MRVATIRQSVARGMLRGAMSAFTGTLAAGLMAGTLHAAVRVNAGGHVDRDMSARKGPLEVSVQVENRRAPLFLASWRPDRWYLEAQEGARYQVRVRNTSGERVAFVISVDGLNAINGTRSSLSSHEPMYVLDPYQSTTIKGWRRSLDKVARFVFVDEERSYAERTHQANGDLGWIRVAAFREQPSWIWRKGEEGQIRGESSPRRAGERAAPQSARGAEPMARGDAYGAPDEGNPGTGWGKTERDRVREVEFRPQPFASAQVVLRYEYRSGLLALGIVPNRNGRDRTWERDRGEYGFAVPPPR